LCVLVVAGLLLEHARWHMVMVYSSASFSVQRCMERMASPPLHL
jgi:hypothetical protein